ncbi:MULTISPECIES: hypothetical protein [unclassified Pseudoalteromonas]|uniref:hypothetical protein n=1 Tax=unclassified Pseudoalteromonas TaxID=194690 RepID=UPI00041FCADB|nr:MULTISPECIES: hypothetical protein [unclassified Pseudoalteromonas]
MIHSLSVIPLREARLLQPCPNTALIAVRDSGTELDREVATGEWGYFNKIAFDDAAYSVEQIKDHGREFWNYFDGCARKVHALRILLMIKEIHQINEIQNIIIFCDSGLSRSAAIGKYYSETYGVELHSDTSKANTLLYRLLNNPSYFDEALLEYVEEPKEKKSKEPRNLFPFGWFDLLIEKLLGKQS